MKCTNCGYINKPDSKICKKCGRELIIEPLWKPSLKWYLKILIAIYTILILVFFLLNYLLKPFMRQLPQDITPWLAKNEKATNK